MLTREQKIRALIASDIASGAGQRHWMLASLLRNGCDGYNKMSDTELDIALGESGLADEDVIALAADDTIDFE